MTIRSLFTIVLKVFGLIVLLNIITGLQDTVNTFFYFLSPYAGLEVLWALFPTLLVLGIKVLFMFYLFFRTDIVLNKLRLDSDFFETTIQWNIHSSAVLRIAVLLIAGVITINAVSSLCREVFLFYQKKTLHYPVTAVEQSAIVLEIARFIIGLLLLGQHRELVLLIEKKRRARKVDQS